MSNIELKIKQPNGRYRLATDEEILYGAEPILNREIRNRDCFTSVDKTKLYIQSQLRSLEEEHFMVLYLTSRHVYIADEILFRGSINSATIYPRVVLKHIMKHNAAAVILAHNHPSGSALPSESDKKITRTLQELLRYIDVPVLDHIIVGENTLSFVELGLL